MYMHVYDISWSHRERGLLSLSLFKYVYIYIIYLWVMMSDNFRRQFYSLNLFFFSFFALMTKPQGYCRWAHQKCWYILQIPSSARASLKGRVNLIKDKHHWACISAPHLKLQMPMSMRPGSGCSTLQHLPHTGTCVTHQHCRLVDPLYIVDSVDPL